MSVIKLFFFKYGKVDTKEENLDVPNIKKAKNFNWELC